jgi:gamma-glutamyl:cysteine ligase YbdK (ATP-grasp superfamily)
MRHHPSYSLEPHSYAVEFSPNPTPSIEELAKTYTEIVRNFQGVLDDLGLAFAPGSWFMTGVPPFRRSKPGDDYHSFIEQTHGMSIASTSTHTNLGIGDLKDPELLIKVNNYFRLFMVPALMALSANSPFHNSQLGDWVSMRAKFFPNVPNLSNVPLFKGFQHCGEYFEQIHFPYVRGLTGQFTTSEYFKSGRHPNISEEKLKRYFWSILRLNGDERPWNVNRLEVRAVESMRSPYDYFALLSLAQAHMQKLIQYPDLLDLSKHSEEELKVIQGISDQNYWHSAQAGLDALWINPLKPSEQKTLRDLVREMLQDPEILFFADMLGSRRFLEGLEEIIELGSGSERLIKMHKAGHSVEEILAILTEENKETERRFAKEFA